MKSAYTRTAPASAAFARLVRRSPSFCLLVILSLGVWGCPGSPLAEMLGIPRNQDSDSDGGAMDGMPGDGEDSETVEMAEIPIPVIVAFNVQDGATSLEWVISDALEAETVSSYIVQRSEEPDTGFTGTRVIARFDQPPFIDTDIRPGTTYYYRVVAVGLAGDEGQPSETIMLTVPSSPGQIFIAAGDIVGIVDLNILGVSDLNGANPDFASENVQNIVRAQGSQLWRIGTTRWNPGDVLVEAELFDREIFFGTTIEHARDPQFYNFDYIDRAVTNVIGSGGSPIITIDSMPNSLARNTGLLFRSPNLSWSDNLRNSPPRDAEVFAEVVVQIIAHFRRGFAGGFEFDLPIWELWNAPDLTQSTDGTNGIYWTGTLDEFSDMFAVVYNRVKEEYGDGVSFGGAGFVKPVSVGSFLDQLAARDVTPDFVSYSAYDDQIAGLAEFASAVQTEVVSRGLDNLDVMLSGWNLALPRLGIDPDFFFVTNQPKFDSTGHAIQYLAVFQTALDLEVDIVLHEGLRDYSTGLNLGLITTTNLKKPVTSLVEALQSYRNRKDRLRLEPEETIGLAGVNEDRTEVTVIVANPQDSETEFSVDIDDLPWDEETGYSWTLTILNDAFFGINGGFAGDVAGGGSGTRLRIVDVEMAPQSIMRLDVVRD